MDQGRVRVSQHQHPIHVRMFACMQRQPHHSWPVLLRWLGAIGVVVASREDTPRARVRAKARAWARAKARDNGRAKGVGGIMVGARARAMVWAGVGGCGCASNIYYSLFGHSHSIDSGWIVCLVKWMLDVVDGLPWLAVRYLVFRYWRGHVIGTLLERPCARRYWMVRMAWRHHHHHDQCLGFGQMLGPMPGLELGIGLMPRQL